MSKIIKKVTGVVLMIALLVTTAGTSVEAAKRVQWPYGTYKCTTKSYGDVRLDWQYGDGENGYDNFVYWYYKGMRKDTEIMYAMKEVAKNTYRTKPERVSGKKLYFQIKVAKNSLVFKEIHGNKAIYWDGTYPKLNFKIQKRLPKNVG